MITHTETIEWITAGDRLPDADQLVLLRVHGTDRNSGEPVWIGYWDDFDRFWRWADGQPIEIAVLFWAAMPAGPDVSDTGSEPVRSARRTRAQQVPAGRKR